MSRLFTPISFVLGTLAGARVFKAAWEAVDKDEPPDPARRVIRWPKVLLAAAMKGAIVGMSRAVMHHSTRRAFYGLTGSWPGAERPDPRS